MSAPVAMSNEPFGLDGPGRAAAEQVEQFALHIDRSIGRRLVQSRYFRVIAIDGHLVFELIDQVQRGGRGGNWVGVRAGGNGDFERAWPSPGG